MSEFFESGQAEDKLAKDITVFINMADEIEDEDYFGSVSDYEPDNKKTEMVAEALPEDLDKLLRAARYYYMKRLESEVKANMRAKPDAMLEKWQRSGQINNILMDLFWFSVNDRYNLWMNNNICIRNNNGKIAVMINHEESDIMEKFGKLMGKRGGMGGKMFEVKNMDDLMKIKKMIDELGDMMGMGG